MSENVPPAPPGSGRVWLYVVLAFLAFWAAYLALLGPGGGRTRPAATGPADYAWTLEDLSGQPVRFDRFKGRPVFLNIWATWCPPCVRELPSIARLAADPKLEGVAVVCVATDESLEDVTGFVKSKGWPASMTVLHARDVPRAFATDGIPATFLIDADGKIVHSEVGAGDWSVSSVVEFLQKLKAGSPLPPGAAPQSGPL